MNLIDRALRQIAPGAALRRAQARRAHDLLMRYAAVEGDGRRPGARRPTTDADTTGQARAMLAALSRDLIRNTPLGTRAQQVIASNVVGDGIIPKIVAKDTRANAELLDLVERHFDTTAIDADGRQNLYGLQRLVTNAVVDAGEVLIRRRRRNLSDGLPLPFQIQVMEADYLDNGVDQPGVAPVDGRPGRNLIRDGIEYDAIGRRVAYWLFTEHPGGRSRWTSKWESRRVPASEILHIYRQDRPGQMRGVTWYAPLLLKMQDLADYDDAELVRQKIAACFTAFRTSVDASLPDGMTEEDFEGTSLSPGRIERLLPGEDVKFAQPPRVDGYDPFTKGVHRSLAAGLGITYEALTGDLSQVNFASGRMGRMEMDRNISAWQWLMLIPQMMQPLAAWTIEAWSVSSSRPRPAKLDWVPPLRMLVDPAKELGAMRDEVRSGFASRSAQVRRLGYDPERVMVEIATDNAVADSKKLVFDSDPRRTSAAGLSQAAPTEPPEEPTDG